MPSTNSKQLKRHSSERGKTYYEYLQSIMESWLCSCLHLNSSREKDEQQEDDPCDPKKIFPDLRPSDSNLSDFLDLNSKCIVPEKIIPFQLLHYRGKSSNKSGKNLNFDVIQSPVNSLSFFVRPVQHASDSMIATTVNIQDFLGADYPNDFRQKWLKYSFTKNLNCCETIKVFNEIMRSSLNGSIEAVSAGRAMQSVIKHYHEEHKGRDKQYALAFIFMKNGTCKFFAAVSPDFINHTHSEEILIEKIDKFLQKNESLEIESILIYTLNSPCLKRPGIYTCPCMFQLLIKAFKWHTEYGFYTYVIFTKFWGLCGPRFWDESKDSSISCHMSCVSSPLNFTVDIYKVNSFDETIKCVQVSDRRTLNKDLKSALKDSTRLTSDHPTGHFCEELTKKKKKKINEMLNFAAVNLFVKDLKLYFGDSCPLQIYQLVIS